MQARTRKKEFLEQIERIIPWSQWIGIIKPHYYKGERGNKPFALETMLRIHLLQELYDLADIAVMNKVIGSRAIQKLTNGEATIVTDLGGVAISVYLTFRGGSDNIQTQ